MFLQLLMIPLTLIQALWERFRCWIYDVVIFKVTSLWYREFLVTCPPNAAVLDVGIGTATSLIANRDLVVTKKLTIHGVDYDDGYVKAANDLVATHRLQSQIQLKCASIHDFKGPQDMPEPPQDQSGYDVIYFSGSFMIIPDKEKALKLVAGMLRPQANADNIRQGVRTSGGKICFTQTFERPGIVGSMLALVKPIFKFLLTIDFGGITYEEDFKNTLARADVGIEEIKVLRESYFRKQVLVIAKPLPPVAAQQQSSPVSKKAQ